MVFAVSKPVWAAKKAEAGGAKVSRQASKVKKPLSKLNKVKAPKKIPRTQSLQVNQVSDLELEAIYKAIAQGQSTLALGRTEALLQKAPNYKLLHFLRADLLLILSQKHTIPTNQGTSFALPALIPAHQLRINELQQEAWLRVNSLAIQSTLSKGLVQPRPLLKLAENEPYALVVDSKMSRLYVYQNIPNARPKLLNDYYITQGAQGAFKLKEGDARTPIGAYFINGPVTQKLPDFYGYGALNIDYPNAWDKSKGRTGHGIWLHGTPSETYARPPYASNGCVVLANPDVEMIFKLAKNGAMPIVVVDKLEWVEPSVLEKSKLTLLEALEQWRSNLESGNVKGLERLYSASFLAADADKKTINLLSANNPSKIALSNITMIEYPGELDLVTMRFEFNAAQNTLIRKQLYWKKEAGTWKIVLENSL